MEARLRVILTEATHLGEKRERHPRQDAVDDVVDKLLSGARPVEVGSGDRTIELIWQQPAAYVVLDESYAGFEAPVVPPVETALHVLPNGAFRGYLTGNSYFGLMPDQCVEYLLLTSQAVLKVFSAHPPQARVLKVHA